MPRTDRSLGVCRAGLALLAASCIPPVAAHDYAGPQGTVTVDWQVPQVSRVLSSGSGDAFGIEAAVKMGFPVTETIDGKQCVVGSFFLFDVSDDYAFDIDETVDIEILFDRRRSNGIWFSYDRNGLAEPLHEIEFEDSDDRFYWHRIEAERARFANRGQASSDFAVAALSAMWPGVPDQNHQIVLCDLKIRRSGETVAAREFGEFELTIVDAAGDVTPARVGIYDETGRMPLPSEHALAIRNYGDTTRQIFLRATHGTLTPWPHDNRHVFYTGGGYAATLPAGKYRLVISKGPEYELIKRDIVIRRGKTTAVEIALRRWINMPAAGWYSGDDHVHMTRAASDNTGISRIMQAEDVHVTNLLQMGNPAGTHFHQYAFGADGRHLEGRHALVSGVEDPRTALRGHTISLNIREVLRDPELYLQYEKIFDAYRKQGGLSGYAHVAGELFHVDRGLALDVPLGSVDFIEVMQDGILATGLWYDFLNLGFKLIPTAGSDFPYLGHPGQERNYVHAGDAFSIDAFYARLRAGHTFVTNGPMLELTVNGQMMGSTLELNPGDEVAISAKAALNPDLEPLNRLELVIHGETATVAYDLSGDNSIEIEHTIAAGDGLWIAARAYGKTQAAAHTAPVYVVTGTGGFRKRHGMQATADAMLARLAEYDSLEVDAGSELEVWSVGPPLEAMLQEQRRHLLERVAKARSAYRALADPSPTSDKN